MLHKSSNYGKVTVKKSQKGAIGMKGNRDVQIADIVHRRSDETIQFNQYVTRDASNEPLFVYQSGVKHTTPPGWQSIPAVYDHYIIHFVVSGKGVFMPGHGDYPVQAGDAFLIQPYRLVTYQADAENPYAYYWVGFNGTEADKLVKQSGFFEQQPVIRFDMDEDVLGAMRDLTGTQLTNSSQEYLLLSYLYKMFAALIGQNRMRFTSSYSDYCYSASCYIRQHLNSHDLSVQSVADHIGIDRSHLYRVFQETLHQSVKSFILSARMQKARELLVHSGDRIGDVAASCGFEDTAYFIAQFKRAAGMTPLCYRRSHQ